MASKRSIRPEPRIQGRRLEESRDEVEQRLRALFDNAALGIVEVDRENRVMTANNRICQILGYQREELLGKTVHELTALEDRERTDRLNAELHEGRRDWFDYEKRYLKRDGTPVWVHVTVSAVRDRDGRHVRSISTVEDVSRRKEAEEEVRESRNRMELSLDAMRAGISYWNMSGAGSTYWNERQFQILGFRPGSVEPSFELWKASVHPEDREWVIMRLDKSIRERSDFQSEYRVVRTDGEVAWVRSARRFIYDHSGNPASSMGIMIDITDRKRMEQAISRSEETLRTIFNSVYEGIILHSTDGAILDMNEQFLAMYRVNREQLLKLTIADISSPLSPISELPKIWARVMAGEKQLFEWKAKRPLDGSVFDVEVFLSRFQAGGRDLVLAAVRDVTERKRTEDALRRSEALLKNVLETLPVGVWIIDQDGNIVHGNPAARTIWGGGKYVGIERFGEYKGWWLHSGKRIEPQEWAAARAVQKGETSLNEEVEIECFDGSRKIILNSAVPIRDEHGRVTGAIIVNQDITERKRIEDAVRKERDKAQRYLNVARVIIVAIDPDQRVSLINQKGCEILGYPEEEIVGKNWFDQFIPAGIREVVKSVFAGLIRGEVALFESHENRVLTRDGGVRLIYWHNSAVRDEAGNIAGILSSGEDITDSRRAEEERMRLMAELQRSNAELQHFAYVASHDLQEPLRTMSGFIELLAEKYRGKLDAKADKYISFVVDGAGRMSNLLDDLLKFSRVGTKGKTFAPVNMDRVAAAVLADLDLSIKESRAVITTGPLPRVTGDENQLKQLLQNLIANAIKFRRKDAGPRIHISARQAGNGWEFSVRDNGIGIEPRFHEQIFTVFQRLHTREEYPGTGMGLAIGKKIVERHGGRIWVESAPGKGAEFFFTIPMRDSA